MYVCLHIILNRIKLIKISDFRNIKGNRKYYGNTTYLDMFSDKIDKMYVIIFRKKLIFIRALYERYEIKLIVDNFPLTHILKKTISTTILKTTKTYIYNTAFC